MGAHISSVPRLLGALGTAPRSNVENEKWAATLPSMRGRSVSSSRYSSAAFTAKPLRRNKQMRDHFILRADEEIEAMPAFPAQSGLYGRVLYPGWPYWFLVPTHVLFMDCLVWCLAFHTQLLLDVSFLASSRIKPNRTTSKTANQALCRLTRSRTTA